MFRRSTNVITESQGRRFGIVGARVALVGATTVCMLAASMLVAGAASAGHFAKLGKPIPPGSIAAAFRGGYPELTARWWTWATGIFPETPIADTTGELCDQGQHGSVWFLAGSFGGSIGPGTVVRDCAVPRWKTLFFPVFNTLWWVPEDGDTAADVRILANQNASPDGLEMEVLVDGVALEDIFGYRAQSPPGGSLYRIEEGSWGTDFGGLAPPNFFPPGDRFPAVADGYWVMLRRLSRGQHTVVIRAFVPDLLGPGADFDLDVTYNLTVD